MTMTQRLGDSRRNGDEYEPDMLALTDPVNRRLLLGLAGGAATADAIAEATGLELGETQRGLVHLVGIELAVQYREGVGHEMFYTLAPRVRFTRSGEFISIDILGNGRRLQRLRIRARTSRWV